MDSLVLGFRGTGRRPSVSARPVAFTRAPGARASLGVDVRPPWRGFRVMPTRRVWATAGTRSRP